jgi:hypothetical protein
MAFPPNDRAWIIKKPVLSGIDVRRPTSIEQRFRSPLDRQPCGLPIPIALQSEPAGRSTHCAGALSP